MTLETVNRGQRWTKDRPCPGCGGWDLMPRGKGRRCSGYLGVGGTIFHCSREEIAGGLPQEAGGTYAHRLEGPCRCGATHRDAPVEYRDLKPANGAVRLNGNGKANGSNGTHAADECHCEEDDYREVGSWSYEGGLVVVRKECRHGEKIYRQRHRHADGSLGWGLNPGKRCPPGCTGATRTLYREAEVRAATGQTFVMLPEGEKCVDALVACGFVATTTPQGASSWDKTAERAASVLAGRHVVILPDHDQDGSKYAASATATLERVCASLRVLELPGLGDAEDVANWLERGGDPEDLVKMAEARPNIAKTPPPRVSWISTGSIFEPVPPTSWVSPDLGLCPGRPALLAAYGFSGKTIISQAEVLAFATGRSLWGHFPVDLPIRIRHFDYEQGQHATRKRYQRLARGMGIDPRELGDRLELCVFPDVYLNSPDAVDVFAKESDGCGLVLLDALRGATPGEDENDSKMRACLDMLSRVSEKNGTTFQLLHHARKTKEGDRDARMILRGSSGIFDACGSILVLTGDHDGTRVVQQVKAPAEAEGGSVPEFRLRIEDVAIGGDPRAGVCVVYEPACAAAATAAAAPSVGTGPARSRTNGRPKTTTFGDIRQAVVDLVREHTGELSSANAISVRMTLGSRMDRLQAVKELESEKVIVMVAGGFRVRPPQGTNSDPYQVVP